MFEISRGNCVSTSRDSLKILKSCISTSNSTNIPPQKDNNVMFSEDNDNVKSYFKGDDKNPSTKTKDFFYDGNRP